jgi:spoIIIJ-associated protein
MRPPPPDLPDRTQREHHVSESTTSETDLSETTLPGADGPETDRPETDRPETDLSGTELSSPDVSDADAPDTDVPDTDVPSTDVPGTDVPGTDVTEAAPQSGADGGAGSAAATVAVEDETTGGEGDLAAFDTSDDAAGVLDAPTDEGAAAAAGTAGVSAVDGDVTGEPEASDDLERLENEGDIAADYLEELLDIADLDGDLDMDVEGDRAAVSIVGGDIRLLVGRDGEVLEALQELTRLAVYRETGERSRLMLDVGGFRADKRTRLEKVAAEAVAQVKESGERKALDPMTPFERKVVHDVVAASGLSSASEGQEPRRYVVVLPE